MTDIATVWDVSTSTGDWVLQAAAPGVHGGSLQSGDDLTTAVIISLFTDRMAESSDQIPDGTTNRRGWWGDLGQDVPIGSRLWLLTRSKLLPSIPKTAKGYVEEALKWMLNDKVASRIDVTTAIASRSMLTIQIQIYQSDDTSRALTFNWAWQQLD